MDWQAFFIENWHVKLVCATLIVAAYIDGKQLRVPNWITFPMVLSGLAYNAWGAGWEGLGMAPTGRALKLSGMSALRVRDGKLAEGWNNWDQMGMARQLGVLEGKAAELFR